MRKFAIFTALAALVLLCACADGDVVSATPPSEEVPPSVVVPTDTPPVSEEPSDIPVERLEVKGEITGSSYHWIDYPVIQSNSEQVAAINDYISNWALNYGQDCLDNKYGVDAGYTIGYNASNIVSFLFDIVERHEQVTGVTSEYKYWALTVNAEQGTRVALDELFTVSRDEYLAKLFEYDTVLFDVENFYLDSDELVLLFAPNTVSDDGEWYFHNVPYSEVSDILADWVIYD